MESSARAFAPVEDASRTASVSPFVYETVLDNSTWGARRLSKKKKKLISRIQVRTKRILEPGERVRYLSFGCSVSFWESYFLGIAMYYFNRRAILLTDRRMILLQIDSRNRPGRLLSQIRYAAIRKVGRTILGNTRLTLGDGRKHVFTQVPRRDRKFLQKLTEWIDRSLVREAAGWEDLCPRCFKVVSGRPARCASCGAGFKSARKAGLLSLVYPGLGDFYMGHRKFAILEMLVAAIFWLSVFAPDPELGTVTPGLFLFMAAFIFVFIHGADAIATWYLARKGVYPEGA